MVRVKRREDIERCRLSKRARRWLGKEMVTAGLNPYETAALVRSYGSLQHGLRAILRRNFNRKTGRPLSKVGSSEACTEKLSHVKGKHKNILLLGEH
ncbi:MAG: hypothetical protein ABH864_06475 [archaeon]